VQFERESPPYDEGLDEVKLHTQVRFEGRSSWSSDVIVATQEFWVVQSILHVPGVTFVETAGFSILIKKGRLFSFDDILPRVTAILEQAFGGPDAVIPEVYSQENPYLSPELKAHLKSLWNPSPESKP
jgi:hypothetical protein